LSSRQHPPLITIDLGPRQGGRTWPSIGSSGICSAIALALASLGVPCSSTRVVTVPSPSPRVPPSGAEPPSRCSVRATPGDSSRGERALHPMPTPIRPTAATRMPTPTPSAHSPSGTAPARTSGRAALGGAMTRTGTAALLGTGSPMSGASASGPARSATDAASLSSSSANLLAAGSFSSILSMRAASRANTRVHCQAHWWRMNTSSPGPSWPHTATHGTSLASSRKPTRRPPATSCSGSHVPGCRRR
jgi:hypothetical protein